MAELARIKSNGSYTPKWHLFVSEESGAIRFQCRKGNGQGEKWPRRLIPLLRAVSKLEFTEGNPDCEHCYTLCFLVRESVSRTLEVLDGGRT